MRKVKITGLPEDYESINHFDLRSDLENDRIVDCFLVAKGKISDSPETWALDIYLDEEEDSGNSFLYESEFEYNQDVEILFK